MEDEDSESKIKDMWNILGDQQLKDATLGNSLKHSIDSVYTDGIDEEKQIIRYNSVSTKDSSSKNTGAGSKIIFKGFKKRILAQAQETQTNSSRTVTQEQHSPHSNVSPKNIKDKKIDTKRGKITEYAQYLGLQPSSKSKCSKCNAFSNFCPTLKQNLCTCNSTMAPIQGSASTSESSSLPHAANFKITRKVYLCAACGTYFENWNLFLHMRDIHKRHICLFCLGMFGQAERLSYHLSKKHSVPEMAFTSVEDFYSVFKGSCYLVCCSCEKVFSETDNFYNHFCSPSIKQDTTSVCTLCRQTGTHANTCSLAIEANKESTSSIPIATVAQTSTISSLVPAKPIHVGSKISMRKLIKNNRTKPEDSSMNSHQQKPNVHIKTTSTKVITSQCNENQVTSDIISKGKAIFDETRDNSVKDTVSETIMEVSKYVNDSCSEENDNRSVSYDSVTETIMEVSRYTNETEEEDSSRIKDSVLSHITSTADKIDSENNKMSVSDLVHITTESIIKSGEFSLHQPEIEKTVILTQSAENGESTEDEKNVENVENIGNTKNTENTGNTENIESTENVENAKNTENTENIENTEHKESTENTKSTRSTENEDITENTENAEDTHDTDSTDNTDDRHTTHETKPSEEPPKSVSPVSRSLFSPQHESHISELQSKEISPYDNNKQNEPDITESQTSVSFNTVTSSDRSLVIKICANKNSQFSVSNAINNNENHDEARDSEENNNAEESTSEGKLSVVSEKEQDGTSSFQVNDVDSDSDSDKLAVVDSNAEEIEEAEETEDVEDVEDAEDAEDAENTEEAEEAGEAGDTEETGETQEVEKAEDTRTNANIRIQAHNDTETNTSLHEEEGKVSTKDANEDFNKEAQPNNIVNDDASNDKQPQVQRNDGIALAGEDVPTIDFNVEGTLDSMEIEDLLKRCIEAASPFCVYCNHARHIAVNGKQLGLHMLAEHKFQPQHPAIVIHLEQFTARVKKSLEELESCYFNLDSYSSTNGTYNVPDTRTYECFHCRFHSAIHKELYLHNRKMHQKTILICIMCKSTFYSYSELLCHLCPGVYAPNMNVKYRCCLCPVGNLPSAFRLMVHLRKRHHACDVCLEATGNQQRLSNHVWKHKLHHLCYRCGIAYRNKPDITKHLFWKHGTESVLCKKCLQKKWPHIYHFCIPPTAFVCEECGSSFSRAVALKVHKRLHSGDQPYVCNECSHRFISQKLLTKHEASHKEPPVTDVNVADVTNHTPIVDDEKSNKDKVLIVDDAIPVAESGKDPKESVKKVVDVYDLPPLNLSSESDTDAEDEKTSAKEQSSAEKEKPDKQAVMGTTLKESEGPPSPVLNEDNITEVERNEEEKKQEAQIMDGIWDNFKSYAASLEIQETTNITSSKETEAECQLSFLRSVILADHDYCVVWSDKEKARELGGSTVDSATKDEDNPNSQYKEQRSPSAGSVAQNVSGEGDSKKKVKTPKKKKNQNGSTSSSDSSSDSDSSSCSCGTNCSCSSTSSGSSSSSSSSSDSDSSASENSPRKQSSRKERKKDKDCSQENKNGMTDVENKEAQGHVENGTTEAPVEPVPPPKLLLRESDLDTDETDTDEDFYDEHPQQLANKLLAEKRNQLLLLAAVAPASTETTMSLNNGITDAESVAPSPNPLVTGMEEQPQKRKVKTKKRKKGERGKQRNATPTVESIKLNIPKALYQKNPGYSSSSPAAVMLQPSRSSTPSSSMNEIVHTATAGMEFQSVVMSNQNVGGSGSETENKRSSKRKRVPKRFYGDSSDEEADKQPAMKWRKTTEPFIPATNLKTIPPRMSFGGKTVSYKPTPVEAPIENQAVATTASATESEEQPESSSESSDSEEEASSQAQQIHVPEVANPPVPERSVNLYCYCQCPYDEVSEMIACDGQNCRIEWFHFECVGIMVPPKGKWYCPDCRKKHGIVQNSEDYFD